MFLDPPAARAILKALNYQFIFSAPTRAPSTVWRQTLFVLWLVGVCTLVAHHVVWRDEVRALSYALQGKDMVDMLKALRGEGHPALWYLLLRAAHTLVPMSQVLPAMALATAVAAIWLLVFRSPFALPVIALLLASRCAAYEFSVMARNYGISMLLMFLFATLYEQWRNRGWILGLLLFLLANTNTQSVLLVLAFLLFWLLETVRMTGLRWSHELKVFLLNALLAGVGILLCWLTVHPLINDAAIIDHSGGLHPAQIATQMISPAIGFEALFGNPFLYLTPERIGSSGFLLMQTFLSIFLFGATLGLLPRPTALVAALAALIVMSVFFGSVAPGAYRHQALWLIFLVSIYWIEGRDSAQRTRVNDDFKAQRAATLGSMLFLLLMLLQLPATAVRAAHPGDESQSANFARLIRGSVPLKDAIIVADPDYLVETIPYYLSNPTYLIHEHRFGSIPAFTKNGQLNLSLEQILATARELRAENQRPVVILLQASLSMSQPDMTYSEAYNWKLTATSAMVQDFLANTQRIASFPPPREDDGFDVYTLK